MKPLTRLTAFVLDQAESQSLEKRIELYRDLLAISPDHHQAQQLEKMARELEGVQRRSRQLQLTLRSILEPSRAQQPKEAA